jgi:ATP-dependent DNA helicase RecQ
LQDKLDNVPEGALKTCTRLLKEARLLRQDRQLRYGPGKARPTAALFASLETRQQEKQEHDRQALERMVSYALSGYCRWKLLLDYFGADQTFERCCTCDNCVSPPAAGIAPAEETTAPSVETIAPSCRQRVIAAGARVSVPKFDTGTVLSVEGDKITIEFPNSEVRTFMEEFVRIDGAAAPEPVSETV